MKTEFSTECRHPVLATIIMLSLIVSVPLLALLLLWDLGKFNAVVNLYFDE